MHAYLQAVATHAGRCVQREFAELPTHCPLCHHHAAPWRIAARSTDATDTHIDFAFQCSRPECRRVFVEQYRLGDDGEYELAGAPWERLQLTTPL